MTDLLKIGTSALMGNQSNLATTTNNIANVNTPGYSRQRTEYTDFKQWGVSPPEVARLFDRYAIDQVRRDTSENSRLETFSENSTFIDQLFADDSTSLSSDLDSVFQRIHEMNDQPSSLVPRQLFLSDAKAFMKKIEGVNERIFQQESRINQELKLEVNETNSLIKGFYELNLKIVSSATSGGDKYKAASPELLDERDEIARRLAEKMDISIIESANGLYFLNTSGGQPLVTNGNYFQLNTINGDPDPLRSELEIYVNSSPNNAKKLNTDNLGGSMGGVIEYRTQVLDKTVNSIGQLSISFADAMNEQNKLGVDLQGNLGKNIFTIPTNEAMGYQDNSSLFHNIEVGIEAGQADKVSNFDYEINFVSATEYTITSYSAGNEVESFPDPATTSPAISVFTIPASSATFSDSADQLPDGLSLRFAPDTAFATGDKFLVRPTRLNGDSISMNIVQPSEVALAAPIQVTDRIENIGGGSIEIENVTTTQTLPTNSSGFNAAGGFDTDAPASVFINAAGQYVVRDTTGADIGTVANGDNIMKQLNDAGTWPTKGDDYPGYDINIKGNPEPGDQFDIAYNADGIDSNFNGSKLTDLQSADTMRLNIAGEQSGALSFSGSYANLIGFIGDSASRASIDLDASRILLQQSENRVQETAGVNLDEEAADLVKFQQAYNASARIITVAQDIFNTLLQAVR